MFQGLIISFLTSEEILKQVQNDGNLDAVILEKSTTIKHLLIIRSSAMGDVAMAVHPIIALTNAYPDLKVTVLTNSFFSPFFETIPNVTVISLDKKGKHKGFLGLKKLSNEIKSLGIDAIADFHGVLRTNILKNLLRFSNIPFAQIDKGRTEKKALTRSKNKIFKPLKSSHQRYIDVLTTLSFKVELQADDVLPKKKLSTDTQEFISQNTKKWIGIAPFAQHQGKMYPYKKIEAIIEQLDSTNEYDIFLFGGGKKEVSILKKTANAFSNVTNIAGQVSFSEELALISNLDLMLSMDSGNGHLAALFGISVITIWGVTHPYTGFMPFGQSLENSLIPDLEQFPLIPTSIYGNKFPEGYEVAAASIDQNQIIEKITFTLQ